MICKTVKVDEAARLEIYYKEGRLMPKEINFYFQPEQLTEQDRRFLGHPEYNEPIVTELGRYAPAIRPSNSADLADDEKILQLLKKYCEEEDAKVLKELEEAAQKYLAGGIYWYNKFEKYHPECIAERNRREAEQTAQKEADKRKAAEQEEKDAAEFNEFLSHANPTIRAQVDAGYLTKSQCRTEIDKYLMEKTGYRAIPTDTERPSSPTIEQIRAAQEEGAELQEENGKMYLYKTIRFAGMQFPLFKEID